MLRQMLPLILLPFPVMADDFQVTSRVTEATLFHPFTGEVVRRAAFSIPEGRHRLIVTDLPLGSDVSGLRLSADGVRLGAVTSRTEARPTQGVEDSEAVRAAKAEVERLDAELRIAGDRVAEIRLRAEAAEMQIAYLRNLRPGEEPPNAEGVGAMVRQIGGDALAALQSAHSARIEAREADLALKDLSEDLEDAKRALEALVAEDPERLFLAIAVTAEAPTEGVLELRYWAEDVGWWPVYEVDLAQDEPAELTIRRGALIYQETGENWQDVAVTLSTTPFDEGVAASDLSTYLRRISPPISPAPNVRMKSSSLMADELAVGGARMEPAVIVEEAGAGFDGPSVTYSYPTPLSLASGADEVRISLGAVTTEAEVFARATPFYDRTAFLTAAFTNDTGEPILATQELSLFLDGALVGVEFLDEPISEGVEAELGFGPLQSVLVSRTVEDRNEGDRGVISRSNVESETARLRVENRGTAPVTLRLRDRVPVSDQEDLKIAWEANPRATEEDVDDRRGVLEWRFSLAPGDEQDIRLSHELRWPEGQILQ